jgi:hypothetical protein
MLAPPAAPPPEPPPASRPDADTRADDATDPPTQRHSRPDNGRSSDAASTVTPRPQPPPRPPSRPPTPPEPHPNVAPPPTTRPAPIPASPSPDALRRRRPQIGRNRSLSRITWRACVAHQPAQDRPGGCSIADTGSPRSRAGLRPADGACPRSAAGRVVPGVEHGCAAGMLAGGGHFRRSRYGLIRARGCSLG